MSQQTDPKSEPTYSPIPLSYREVRFVHGYLEHGNKTQAARDAGYKSISEEGLHTLACALLRKTQVANYYGECLQQFLDAERITKPKLAQALAYEAFADRTSIFDEAGDVINPRDWPAELKAIVVGYDATVLRDPITGEVIGTRYKIKFVNPTQAKITLAEWRGLIGPKATNEAASMGAGVTVILEADSPPPTDQEEEST